MVDESPGALDFNLDCMGWSDEDLGFVLFTAYPDRLPWSAVDGRLDTSRIDGFQAVWANSYHDSWRVEMHWKLLAVRAANLEDPHMLIVEHDCVSDRVYFGGVRNSVQGTPSLDVSVGESMSCPHLLGWCPAAT